MYPDRKLDGVFLPAQISVQREGCQSVCVLDKATWRCASYYLTDLCNLKRSLTFFCLHISERMGRAGGTVGARTGQWKNQNEQWYLGVPPKALTAPVFFLFSA